MEEIGWVYQDTYGWHMKCGFTGCGVTDYNEKGLDKPAAEAALQRHAEYSHPRLITVYRHDAPRIQERQNQ